MTCQSHRLKFWRLPFHLFHVVRLRTLAQPQRMFVPYSPANWWGTKPKHSLEASQLQCHPTRPAIIQVAAAVNTKGPENRRLVKRFKHGGTAPNTSIHLYRIHWRVVSWYVLIQQKPYFVCSGGQQLEHLLALLRFFPDDGAVEPRILVDWFHWQCTQKQKNSSLAFHQTFQSKLGGTVNVIERLTSEWIQYNQDTLITPGCCQVDFFAWLFHAFIRV